MKSTFASIGEYSVYSCRTALSGFTPLPPKIISREWVEIGYISNYLLSYTKF